MTPTNPQPGQPDSDKTVSAEKIIQSVYDANSYNIALNAEQFDFNRKCMQQYADLRLKEAEAEIEFQRGKRLGAEENEIYLQSQLTESQKIKWVSVAERLPEQLPNKIFSVDVLIYTDRNQILPSAYDYQLKRWNTLVYSEATHWQVLPNPPTK